MAKITYDDKVALNEEPSVAEINKVTDANMNEIKSSVNDLYDTVSNNTADIGTNTSDIDTLKTIANNLGSYTTATGTYTTASWSEGTNTCTWTAPKTGVYLIFARFQANDYSAAQPYKQFQLKGTATRIMGDLGFWQDVANNSFVEGVIVSMPVYATQGQTVIPYVHTDVADKVWNMTITGVFLK
jgi:hypothetical protein